MQLNRRGGLPANYSPSAASTDQRSCTTQSTTGGSTDVSRVDSFYTPSPTLPFDETPQPPQQPLYSHTHSLAHPNQAHSYPQALSSAGANIGAPIQTYPHQHTYIHSAASVPGVLPTPPPTSFDDFDSNSYYSSPASNNCTLQSAAPCSGRSSTNGSGSWSSPDDLQLNFQSATMKSPDSLSLQSLRIEDPPAQHENLFQHHMSSDSPFTGVPYPGVGMDSPQNIMQQSAPPMMPLSPEGDLVYTPSEQSPQLKDELGETYQLASAPSPLDSATASSSKEPPKGALPYAKLIYQCLLNADSHVMNLQDIYQWFKDNTDKGKEEGNGWQNSIRHNLSMNAAFVKRDHKRRREGKLDPADNKKNTDWVLEDWAIQDGVQSTTRYRGKTNNHARRTGGGVRKRTGKLSARASSGRKGGITASKTKAATRRTSAPRSQSSQSPSTYSMTNEPRNPLHAAIYSRPFTFPFGPDARGGQITTPDVNAADITFPPAGNNASVLAAGHVTQGYTYHNTMQHGQSHHNYPQYQQAPQQQQQQHHHQQQQPQQQPGTLYTLDEISGVYQDPSAAVPSLPGRGQGATQAPIPSTYGALFANPDEIHDNRGGSYMGWPHPGPAGGGGGAYHP